jgi:hypothetical protein
MMKEPALNPMQLERLADFIATPLRSFVVIKKILISQAKFLFKRSLGFPT